MKSNVGAGVVVDASAVRARIQNQIDEYEPRIAEMRKRIETFTRWKDDLRVIPSLGAPGTLERITAQDLPRAEADLRRLEAERKRLEAELESDIDARAESVNAAYAVTDEEVDRRADALLERLVRIVRDDVRPVARELQALLDEHGQRRARASELAEQLGVKAPPTLTGRGRVEMRLQFLLGLDEQPLHWPALKPVAPPPPAPPPTDTDQWRHSDPIHSLEELRAQRARVDEDVERARAIDSRIRQNA